MFRRRFKSRVSKPTGKDLDLFFSWSSDPIPFDFTEMSVTGRRGRRLCRLRPCVAPNPVTTGEPKSLAFRLTMGLPKIDGRWTITHEHHFCPRGWIKISRARRRWRRQVPLT